MSYLTSLAGLSDQRRQEVGYLLSQNRKTWLFGSGLAVGSGETSRSIRRTEKRCFLPGANRISMMKYRGLFGGAEPLRLMKEAEADCYRNGGIPGARSQPGRSGI